MIKLRVYLPVFVIFVLAIVALTSNKASATTVSVTDSNVQWSPYGWVASSSTYKQSPTTGSYIDVAFTGTTLGLNVDNSFFSPATLSGLQISAFIDGNTTPVVRTMADISGGQIMFTTGLAPGNHYAHIVITYNTNYTTRWAAVSGTPRSTLRITSIQLQTAASVLPATSTPISKTGPRTLIYGDSITEGNGIGSNGAQSWAAIAGGALNTRFGIHGYAGQSWWISFNSNTADFYYPSNEADYPNGVWNNYFQGNSLLNTATNPASGYKEGAPDVILNNLGINDGNGYSFVLTNSPSQGPTFLEGEALRINDWLEDTRAATGNPYTPIIIVKPFGFGCTTANNPSVSATTQTAYQTLSALYTSTVNQYKTANNDPRVYIVDLGAVGCETVVANSSDNLHPNVAGSLLLGQMAAAQAEQYIYIDLAASFNGQALVNGLALTSSKPTLSGAGIPGSSIVATLGSQTCSTTVTVNSTWSCTFANAIANGAYSLLITETAPWGQVNTLGSYNVTVAVEILAPTGVDVYRQYATAGFLLVGGFGLAARHFRRRHQSYKLL